MKIPIKAFKDDPSLSWEERFNRLLQHHEEETKWLVAYMQSPTAYVFRDGVDRVVHVVLICDGTDSVADDIDARSFAKKYGYYGSIVHKQVDDIGNTWADVLAVHQIK